MNASVETLQRLASLAARSPADRDGLTHIADVLKDAFGAENVWFVYAEDLNWVTCGDPSSGDEVGTGKTGLWLIQQQAQARKGPVAFNIREKLVGEFQAAATATGRRYLAMRIPTSESPAEMVVMRGPWQDGYRQSLLRLVEGIRPPLIAFLERMLNATREDRQREQMSALANAAEVLTRGEDVQSVLVNLASAISSATGYEMVTIDLWDEASQSLVLRVLNNLRWLDTSIGRSWTDSGSPDSPSLQCIRMRQPILMPDIQHHSSTTDEERKYFKWIMLVSAARLPIIFQNEVLGSIAFASWQPRSFPPEEVEGMKGIAAQLAVGLKAMQMYKALAQSKEQLEKYSKQLQANTEIEHRLARTDALTGIPNRRYVEEVIEAELARVGRYGRPLSIGLLDVDKLKAINDDYGHDAGDETLVQLAQLARRSCRKGDVVGRYGGDEYLFVLPEADSRAAMRFGERFRNKVDKHVFRLPGGKTTTVKVSLGVAEIDPLSRRAVADLVASADAALYEAKSAGGNAVRFSPLPTKAA